MAAPSSTTTTAPVKNQFGTFGGVFTPSMLTILGVIMFMRAGYVTGQAGIWMAVVILVIAKSITFFTGLSISAISTNAQVKGGGAYYLISRSLGPEFGGAIGVTLYLAQAFSVPFYILGFAESLTLTFPSLAPYFRIIILITAAALFAINIVGTGWAIKVQYFILATLALSIIAFLGGSILTFDGATFSQNAAPAYTDGNDFWGIFAIYFPAVTGIMAGVNMSGDLKEPSRSLPKGTLAAIGVGFVVYLAQFLIVGGSAGRADLIHQPYELLLDRALFGAAFLVVAGVFAATLSSALGSFMGAPRILQALARDDIFSPLKPFAKGTEKGDEPRRSLILTFLVTVVVLWIAGDDPSGGAFNAVASLLTMFFLYTYGITNLAAFVESVSKNPSFRPRFKFFHWITALLGAAGCIGASLLIDPVASGVALAILAAIYWYVRRRVLSSAFGDARRGFIFERLRRNLVQLAATPPHPKNWRPTTLVMSGNPHTRLTLTTYASWIESGRGIVTLAEIIVGDFCDQRDMRTKAIARLSQFIETNSVAAFPEVVVAGDFDSGLDLLLQAHSIGPIKPNVVMLGWPTDTSRIIPYVSALRLASALSMSIILAVDRGLPYPRGKKRIDVWWRGLDNGSLMVILAYLLAHNWEWSGARIRILRLVPSGEAWTEANEELTQLVEAARIDAEIKVIISEQPFAKELHDNSSDATVVLLGFNPPSDDRAEGFFHGFERLLDGLPTTLLVASSGDADLMA